MSYFKELNRHGKYLTVLREFEGKEAQFRTCHRKTEIIDQYDYAFENIEYLKRSLSELNHIRSGQDPERRFLSPRFGEQFLKNLLVGSIISLIMYFIWRKILNQGPL